MPCLVQIVAPGGCSQRFFSGASDYFSAYANDPAASATREICLLCRDHAGGPGSEYDLVDQVARILWCSGWYQWRSDPGDFKILEKFSCNAREGLSDPAKLKQRSPAAVQLLCKALDRFDAMTGEAIKRLVVETAFAGQNGIDFTDPTPTHRLDSLPGESVSRLEIMCILHAGMKRSNPGMPDAEIGIDLTTEYTAALEMRREGRVSSALCATRFFSFFYAAMWRPETFPRSSHAGE